MKTSTKIFVIYGAVIVVMMSVFLTNSLIQYKKLKQPAAQMLARLDTTQIHHLHVDISQARFNLANNIRRAPKDYIWVERDDQRTRSINFEADLLTSSISNDTLYIKAINEKLSYRFFNIPELLSYTVVSAEGAFVENYE